MTRQFLAVLETVVRDPEVIIDELDGLSREEKEHQRMQQKAHEVGNVRKFHQLKPKPINLQAPPLIQTSYLLGSAQLPLVIRPGQGGGNLLEWGQQNQPLLEAELLKHGAILFRDFHIPTPADFECFASLLCTELFSENSEHVAVKGEGNGNLYTPVFYPPEKKLLWHNENSFNHIWPQKIWFYCAQPATIGGETPIVDSRAVFQHLDPAIREPFLRKKIMYVRNYGEGLGLPWQTVFRTTEKQSVEDYCHKAAIAFEWKDGDHLRTRQVRPAVLIHPRSQEALWWNQAMHWHPACLDPSVRSSLLTLFSEEELPRNCFYGDGTRIEDAVIEEIGKVYAQLEVSFPWQQGDILLLDNMLTAHARNPFEGQRKIYVSMGDMLGMQDIEEEA